MNKNVKVLVVTHKEYSMPEDIMYYPISVGPRKDELCDAFLRDDVGENIADKNSQYSELTALYWGWKNLEYDYLGIVHYRRHMCVRKCKSLLEVLSEKEAIKLLGEYDVLAVKPRKYLETVKNHYINCHKTQHENCKGQIEILGQVIRQKEPSYYECFEKVMNGHSAHMFNMFIMNKADINSYCEWLFDILFEAEKLIIEAGVSYERLMGSLSEFLLDVWLTKNCKKVKDMNLYQTEMDFFKRVKRFIYRRFFEKE